MKNSEQSLSAMAQRLRRHSILMTSEAGSGHPTTCMSCAEIMTALFFEVMRFDPRDPRNRAADAFVLSKGHAAPILYATLKEAGALDGDLLTLRKFGSPLEGHPVPACEWVKVATGSLGQGLSAACGMALSRKQDGISSRVYVLMGDGEVAEGSVWEAAQFASFNKLDNVCAIVDVNALGQSGPTMVRHDLESYARKFTAFGWKAMVVDGHNVRDLCRVFEEAAATRDGPTVIVARTFKGKGVSFLEGKDGWHGKPLKKGQELDSALAEIGNPQVSLTPARVASGTVRARTTPDWKADPELPYGMGQEAATREAYGTALARLGRRVPELVVLDGDVKNSTYAEKFKAAFPDRYVEVFIAEQNMIGVALGMAAEGKIPCASSFACFLTRAYDQIRMAAYSRPDHLVICGSHSGVSIGEDGPSQMGLEDIAMMRAVFGSTVLYPSDAVSSERLLEQAIRTPGIVYFRTTRPKTKVLYPAGENFPVGGSKVLRQSKQDRVTIVAAGITLHEALAAYETLKNEGIAVRVIDCYSVKPIDEATLKQAARETKAVITVEDHSIHGGLGEAVAHALGGAAPMNIMGIKDFPRSGPPAQLMDTYGISAKAIVAAVRSIV